MYSILWVKRILKPLTDVAMNVSLWKCQSALILWLQESIIGDITKTPLGINNQCNKYIARYSFEDGVSNYLFYLQAFKYRRDWIGMPIVLLHLTHHVHWHIHFSSEN